MDDWGTTRGTVNCVYVVEQKWYHVTMAYDQQANNSLYLYINGQHCQTIVSITNKQTAQLSH